MKLQINHDNTLPYLVTHGSIEILLAESTSAWNGNKLYEKEKGLCYVATVINIRLNFNFDSCMLFQTVDFHPYGFMKT